VCHVVNISLGHSLLNLHRHTCASKNIQISADGCAYRITEVYMHHSETLYSWAITEAVTCYTSTRDFFLSCSNI